MPKFGLKLLSSFFKTLRWILRMDSEDVDCPIGSIVAFKSGYHEASVIAREMSISAEEIQFLEKHHLAYLTPDERGIAKAPRPPIFKEVKINPVKPKPVQTGGWFDLKPLQP
jgi:hypothetical protein